MIVILGVWTNPTLPGHDVPVVLILIHIFYTTGTHYRDIF
jgi:hypothetical protein